LKALSPKEREEWKRAGVRLTGTDLHVLILHLSHLSVFRASIV
jgi:hypothetical protein